MEYYTFEYIFDEFSKQKPPTKAEEHDIGKVREKFTEIIDAVGINVDLLRKYRDEKTGKMIGFKSSNGQFYFPETSCDFCVEILKRYTDKDFKALRKGQYKDVPIKTLKFLIDGFTDYLIYLGYDIYTIKSEKFKMEKQIEYPFSIYLFRLSQECRGLLKDAEDYSKSILDSIYEDKVIFTWYMAIRLQKLREYIASVRGNVAEIRCDEIDDFAEKIALNTTTAETMEDIYQTSILADALENDKEYQTLLKKQMDILSTPDFAKNLKGSYNKNNARIKNIIEQHTNELFGDKVQQVYPTSGFKFTNSLDVLHDAVMYTDETEKDNAEIMEKKSDITEEQRQKQKTELSKIYSKFFPSPEPEYVRQIEEKGIIKFPCCAEEIIVYTGATGYIVSKCPRCGKQIRFNLDDMTAEIYESPKGHMKSI